MYIAKTKDFKQIPISEVKQDLRIDQSDNTYNSELDRIIRSSISSIEKQIAGDIVPTINQLEDYDFCGYCYQINEPNILVSAVTITNYLDTTPITYSILSSGYTIQKYNQYTIIKFKKSITAEKINITYSSGFAVIPDDLKRAVIMLTGQLFDVDKNGYVNNVTETKAISRLITPYINIIY